MAAVLLAALVLAGAALGRGSAGLLGQVDGGGAGGGRHRCGLVVAAGGSSRRSLGGSLSGRGRGSSDGSSGFLLLLLSRLSSSGWRQTTIGSRSAGLADGRGALLDGGGTLDERRAGDLVAVGAVVQAEGDTGVVGAVQLCGHDTLGPAGAGARDLEVEALGVVLRAVGLLGGVQGDDLVAQDVVARRDVGGDLDHPAEAVVDELVGGVVARAGGRVDQALLADLEELERRLLDGLAVGVAARREVVEHGALVALRPAVPLEVDAVTGRDRSVPPGILGAPVADNVRAAVGLGTDEAQVGGVVGPADDGGRVGLVGELGDVVALVGHAVDDNVGDLAVGGDDGGAEEGRGQGLRRGRHLGTFHKE